MRLTVCAYILFHVGSCATEIEEISILQTATLKKYVQTDEKVQKDKAACLADILQRGLGLESLAACAQASPAEPWFEGDGAQALVTDTLGDIPKVIWQTARNLHGRSSMLSNSWRALNPDWEYRFLDDDAAEQFMRKHFDDDTLRAYTSFPLAVMRADMLRYAVLMEYGGVYADIDTFTAVPIDRWLGPLVGKNRFPIAFENDVHLCQWGMIAPPKHPAFKSVLDLIVRRMKEVDFKVNVSNEDFVHFHTGPGVFTSGVALALLANHGTALSTSSSELASRVNCTAQHQDENCLGIYFVQQDFGSPLGKWTFGEGSLVNTYMSQWKGGSSWTQEREKLEERKAIDTAALQILDMFEHSSAPASL